MYCYYLNRCTSKIPWAPEVADHEAPHAALEAFSTLGASGACPANAERDLHRWLAGLYNFELQAYTISAPLQVATSANGFPEANHVCITWNTDGLI